MAITDPKNTLAYHGSRVLTSQRDMSEVPVATVVKGVASYTAVNGPSGPHASPEGQALWFYGMNHGVSLIAARRAPLEPLSTWELSFVETYHREMAPRAVRAFYYLLLICTREARHNKSLDHDYSAMAQKFGASVATFFKSIKGGEHSIHKKLLSNPPKATIGTYCEALQWQFYNSSWAGGYGGPAWGAIADCLARFVKGEYSAEMMLDTVWTLSHNNGPIFNKGMLFSMYSYHLIRILDVQRSGQIPHAVLFDAAISNYVESNLRKAMMELKTQFPEEIGDYVDWAVVHALGSVNKYPQELAYQEAKYGLSEAAKAAKEAAEKKKQQEAAAAALKKKAEEEAKALEAAEYKKKWFDVMPGLAVQKIQMPRNEAA